MTTLRTTRPPAAALTILSVALSVALSLGLSLGLTACSSGTPTVDRADLEDQVSAELEDTVGVAPDDISCPGDLEGEEGTEMRCTLTAGSDELGLTVTVTEVDGTDVGFHIEVDEMDEGTDG